jgi:hypothetical protein
MLFLNAGFWPLFWAVIGGGAVLAGLLSLLVTTVTPAHRGQVPVPVEAAPHRAHQPAHPARAA